MQTHFYTRECALSKDGAASRPLPNRFLKQAAYGISCIISFTMLSAPAFANKEGNVSIHAVLRKEVKGKVVSEDGSPVIGVTIAVTGQTRGTTTNEKGEFTISANAGEELVLTMIGFKKLSVKVTDDSKPLNIVMPVDVKLQDEVVVIGYGTQKKINVTGAVSHIKAEQIENRMAPNLASTLQGLAPNLNVVVGNGGGEPGAEPDINVRGTGSLSGGGPLILVDGIQQDINTVSPSDVESISVLKDASASALYGVRAAFGVILITTKKGGISKPKISYNGNYALTTPTTLPSVVSSLEFVTAVNEGYKNAGQANYYSDEHIALIKQYMADPGSLPVTMPNPNNPTAWNPGYVNQNSYDAFYKDFGNNQNHNLSISGGTNAVSYYISGAYYNQGSQWRYGREKFDRYTVTSNVSVKVTDWMRAGLNTKFTRRITDMPHIYPGIGNYYHDIPRRWPINPTFDANGEPFTSTLALMRDGGRDINQYNQLVNSFNVVIEPTKGLTFNMDFNFRLSMAGREDHTKSVTRRTAAGAAYIDGFTAPNGYLSQNSLSNFYSNNIYAAYEKSLRKHYFKVMGGFQTEYSKSESTGASRSQLITDNLPFVTLATGASLVDGSKTHWGTVGFFGRFNYNYDEKFMFEFSSRYDGTSKFQAGKRWGYFPSFSAGYNIAKENFWIDLLPQVSMFKFRASYGTLGNQNISGDYAYLANMGVNTQSPWIMGNERPLYITPQGLVIPTITWEKSSTLDFGLDAAAFNNRLGFEFDWYERKTFNMFGPAEAVPAILGTGAPRRNNATLSTKGWDLAITWKDRIGKVRYNAKLVLSDYKSTVLKYRNPSGSISTHYEGKVINEIWGYVTEGLFQSQAEIDKAASQSFFYATWRPGDVHYRDVNGDGKINAGASTIYDPGDQAIIGNSTPRYSYGVSLGAEYKGFSLDVFVQGIGKRDISLESNMFWGIMTNINASTIFKEHLNYWREDNTNAYFAKPYISGELNKNIKRQSRFLQNGAYARLKNLQFGYTIPTHIANRMGMSKLRFYFSGENLLTFTNMIKTFDPEATGGSYGQGKIYPLSKMYSFGINMNLK